MNKFISIVSVIALVTVSLALPATAHDHRRHHQQSSGEDAAAAIIALGFIAIGVAVANGVSQPAPRHRQYQQQPAPRRHWDQGNQVRPRFVMPQGCRYKGNEYTNLRWHSDPDGQIYVCP